VRLEIDSIRFRNFLSFGSRWQEVDFLYGLNLILGLDHAKDRSNASGKSSFLETIPFALFGKVNRDIKLEQIVNWRNRKNCEVAITFHKGKDEYIIYRALKPDAFTVSKNGTDVPIDARKDIFQKQLEEEVLGIDFNTFMSLVYTNINTTSPVLTMKKPEKRKFLERIFNLQLFNKINEKCNEKLRSIDKKLSDHLMKSQFNEQTINESNRTIANIQSKIRTLVSSASELEDAQDKYEKLKERYAEDRKEYERLQKQIIKAGENHAVLMNIVLSINSKVENVEFKIKTLEKQVDMDRVRGALAEIKQIESERAKYGDPKKLEKGIEEAEKERDEIVTEGDQHLIREMNYEKEISSLETLIEQDVGHLRVMEEEDECPLCGEKITEEKITDLKRKMEINKAKLVRAKEGRKEAVAQKGMVRKEVNIRNDSIHKMKDTLMTIMRLDGDIKEKKAVLKSLDIKKNKGIVERYKNALKKLDDISTKYNTKCTKAGKELADVEHSIKDYKLAIEKLENLERLIDNLENKVVSEKETRASFEEIIESERAKIVSLSGENEIHQKETEKLQLLSDYINFIKECCKDENIKQFVISANMPYLNRRTNHHLSETGHGFYAIIDKWLEAEIKGPGITNASYGSLSGGEGRSIDLSLQMALLDFARLKAGIFPDILVTDELLDSSIDSYGIEKLMRIVKWKQQEDSLKIFLISHRKEVADIDVDRTYLVEKISGFSTITLQ